MEFPGYATLIRFGQSIGALGFDRDDRLETTRVDNSPFIV